MPGVESAVVLSSEFSWACVTRTAIHLRGDGGAIYGGKTIWQ